VKKRIVVICPGRGSYTRDELNYLAKYRSHFGAQIGDWDRWRAELSQPTISDLDQAASFQVSLHTPGENASALIYACAMSDFAAIDRERYEVVAVTGNSMGWYLALRCAGALGEAEGFSVVNTMGSMMRSGIVGGQVIYPMVDEQWQTSPARRQSVEQAIAGIRASGEGEVHYSIFLGGFVVLGGDEVGIKKLLKALPPVDERYPFRLVNHAAFHTPLLQETSARGKSQLSPEWFRSPEVPLIDGRGAIWQPYATDTTALWEYTLGHQVVEPFDFTAAVSVALREFAPDALVLLGPGSSLGGSIGQILIQQRWKDIKSKLEFSQRQEKDPFLIAMGRPEQWKKVVGSQFDV
jgi:acyl transferase domain-containing protein